MKVRVTKDSAKNLSIQISGIIEKDLEPAVILDLDKLTMKPREGWKGIRLDAALWALQEKMGVMLWWEKEQDESSLILVCESRNSMRFEDGVHSPRVADGWNRKVYLSTFKVDEPKALFLILDFDKQ